MLLGFPFHRGLQVQRKVVADDLHPLLVVPLDNLRIPCLWTDTAISLNSSWADWIKSAMALNPHKITPRDTQHNHHNNLQILVDSPLFQSTDRH